MNTSEDVTTGMGEATPTLSGTRDRTRTWRILYIIRKLTTSMKYRMIIIKPMVAPVSGRNWMLINTPNAKKNTTSESNFKVHYAHNTNIVTNNRDVTSQGINPQNNTRNAWDKPWPEME